MASSYDERLPRFSSSKNMNHDRRGGASKTCVPRREPGNERGRLETRHPHPSPLPEGEGAAYGNVILGESRSRSSRGIGPHFAFLSGSKCIVCHFCRLRRFEPRSAMERSKFQTENSALWPQEKSVSNE